MFQAVIFDMDGLLLDSEPVWREVEKDIFGSYGVQIDDELIKETFGLQANEVIEHWYQYQPWPDFDPEKIRLAFNERIRDALSNSDLLMDGAVEAVEMVRAHGMQTAIASSSPGMMIEAFLDKYGLHALFDAAHSSEDDGPGKPHPAVYLSTAEALGAAPKACLAVEDSFNGMIAAKAARMKTVVIPDAEHFDDKRYFLADARLHSLKEFTFDLLDRIAFTGESDPIS